MPECAAVTGIASDKARRRRRLYVGAAVVAAAAVGFAAGRTPVTPPPPSAPSPGEGATPTATTVPTVEALGNDQVVFAVDPELVPDVPEVEGLGEGDPPRPVGRLEAPDGTVSDLILGELIVTSSDRARVEALAETYGGEIVDEFEADDGEPADYLVRIPPFTPDLAALADDLVALEPEHEGRFVASDPAVLALMAVAAAETDDDLLIGLNWVAAPAGIEDGFTREAPNDGVPRSAFNWSYMRSGSAQDIGVDAAWRLLAGAGKLDNRVKILIVDNGFNPNPDFPEVAEIVRGDWTEENPGTCSGGNPCPWHGTDVAIAAAAVPDNEYGAAGPAGPIAELYAFSRPAGSWQTLRQVRRVVEERDIDIVNMSYGRKVTVLKKAAEQRAERLIGRIVDAGALVFASAGNDGEDVDAVSCRNGKCRESFVKLPCETEAVICVGGMGLRTTVKAENSNYGSKTDGRSVDIYGPYYVLSIKDPAAPYATNDVVLVNGTSFASPFVAGVAALVKAADPSLGPDEIWEILRDTAHQGGLGSDPVIEGHQRRINARDAVARALGVTVGPPEITITAPADGEEFTLNEFPEFAATATEFSGLPLPVLWESDVDGPLNAEPTFDKVAVADLFPGVHTITATATDMLGQTTTVSVTIEVVDQPPQASISWPPPGTKVYQGDDITFVGESYDPDRFGPLSDDQVWWRLETGNGDLAAAGFGHDWTHDKLPPGEYVVQFIAFESPYAATAQSTLIVLPVPAGESVPQVQITLPEADQVFGTGGEPVTIQFQGTAVDEQDGTIPGTRFRWTATNEAGTVVELCRGSNFPKNPYPDPGDIGDIAAPPQNPGGFTVFKSCSSFTAELGPDVDAATTWAIRLEAADSAGLIGTATIPIVINFVVG